MDWKLSFVIDLEDFGFLHAKSSPGIDSTSNFKETKQASAIWIYLLTTTIILHNSNSSTSNSSSSSSQSSLLGGALAVVVQPPALLSWRLNAHLSEQYQTPNLHFAREDYLKRSAWQRPQGYDSLFIQASLHYTLQNYFTDVSKWWGVGSLTTWEAGNILKQCQHDSLG